MAEEDAPGASTASLLQLPPELIQHILSYLSPFDLANTAQVCRSLAAPSSDDQLWLPLINEQLPSPLASPGPAGSFRQLYIAHHPHWYLAKQCIWFGDSEPSGKLLLARYDEVRGCIEAYSIVATRGTHTLSFWEKDQEVIIHSFNPKVTLDLHQPVLKLDLDSPKGRGGLDFPSNEQDTSSSLYSKEILMSTFAESGLYSSFMLCRTHPSSATTSATSVWPPLHFPARTRTRNTSRDGYQSSGHRPTSHSEISQSNFRLRKWVEYTGRHSSLPSAAPLFPGSMLAGDGVRIRIPEDVTTYATLPLEAYTPTRRKPWQGIWCGDYSGHGCEFLVITQPDGSAELPLPQGMDWLSQWFRQGSACSPSSSRRSSSASFVSAAEELVASSTDSASESDEADPEPSGRLEAIKLTGDPYIPRGEYTFIAPDLGPSGLMRVADEQLFAGARVVRSAGHIANRGFRNDQYTPSQLILLSHDRLAQFWETFGHISYYHRVDLDALLKLGLEERAGMKQTGEAL